MRAADESCPIHADLATRSILAGEELPPEFASCLRCAEDLRTLRDLRALGCALDWTPPDPACAAQVRSRVLGAMSPTPVAARLRLARRSVPVLALLGAGFSALLLVATGHRHEKGPVATSTTPGSLAIVQARGPARFERTGKAPDEVVRLEEGGIHVAVAHLGPAQRFRIVTGDAVVEVRGTEFDVEAAGARLESVTVERGRVEIRVGTNQPEVLTAGDHWRAHERAGASPPVLRPAPEPARIAHAFKGAPERKEGTRAADRPAAIAEPPLGPVAEPRVMPAAELASGVAPSSPQPVKPPVAPPKPAEVGPATRSTTATSPPESERREREQERADRRELREERRLDRLDHHR